MIENCFKWTAPRLRIPGGPGFKIPPRKPATLPEVFLWYSLLPEGKFRSNTSYHSPTASFLILSNSLFTNDLLA